jgi:hypothetical protein
MYKQMAIRCSKAQNWDGAIEWARRGIATYGDDAARPEVVEDLRVRLEKVTAKQQHTQSRARRTNG